MRCVWPGLILLGSTLVSVPLLPAQSFTFGAQKTLSLAAPSLPTDAVVSLDMNGDGNTDIYVQLTTGNYIYLGDGTGNFSKTPVKANESDTSFQLPPQFYDVNGDGFADEVYFYNSTLDKYGDGYAGAFAVLLGDGKGNFKETTSTGANNVGSLLLAGDFNKDGKIDFATVGFNQDTEGGTVITLYHNTGNGVFKVDIENVSDNSVHASTLADVNGDGKLDLVWSGDPDEIANQFPLYCDYGNGDGTFQSPEVCYNVDSQVDSIASADFNRDGKADLVLATTPKVDATGKPIAGAMPRLMTLLARDGGFSYSSEVGGPVNYQRQYQIYDLNGDGLPDVSNNVDFNRNTGDGAFSTGQVITFSGYNPTLLVPLKRSGGLPAAFLIPYGGTDAGLVLDYRLNTSPK